MTVLTGNLRRRRRNPIIATMPARRLHDRHLYHRSLAHTDEREPKIPSAGIPYQFLGPLAGQQVSKSAPNSGENEW
jgi:hypothetical protein